MKNISMKFKLIVLCSFFLTIVLLVGGYGLIQTFQIVDRLDDISGVQLPAVRKVAIVDMYHEGLQGIVYKALYSAESGDVDLKKELADDFIKSSTEMKKLLSEIDSLNLKQETKTAIRETLPAIYQYIKSADDIVKLSVNGQRAEALHKLKDFNTSFSYLETKLDKLAGLIEADATQSQLLGGEIAHRGKRISGIIIILSLIIGVISSWYIVNSLMNGIANTVENLSQSVHDVQNSSHKMNMVSRRLSSSVESQMSSITQSVTAMDEISAMIKNNNHSAMNASQLSSRTKSSAESGKQTVDKMMHEMKDISYSYDEIQKSINQNGEDIKKIIEVISQIASKTEVINDIVFQTKLLSFNASVEAARAGESGKGFAVVAEEVGNLAQMSGKASNDIALMLKESQDQVKAIAEATTVNIIQILDRGRNKVQSGNSVAAECLDELGKILSCVNDLDHSINEISVAIKEQSIGVDEVNSALKHLDDATHDSTDMSSRSKEASDDLKFQSHALRSSIQSLRKILGAKKNYDVAPLEELGNERAS